MYRKILAFFLEISTYFGVVKICFALPCSTITPPSIKMTLPATSCAKVIS